MLFSFIGVSLLREVLAGLDTRHDTPPSQTSSPIFSHSPVFIRSGSLIHRVPDTVAEMIGGMTARLQGEEPSRSSEAMFGYVRGATSGAWGVMTPSKAPAQQIEQAAGSGGNGSGREGA